MAQAKGILPRQREETESLYGNPRMCGYFVGVTLRPDLDRAAAQEWFKTASRFERSAPDPRVWCLGAPGACSVTSLMVRGLCLLLMSAALLAACQASPVPPSSSPSPRQATSGPSGPESVWGPLAVALDDARSDLDAGTDPGRLSIGARCVTLFVEGAVPPLTLIWRSGQTRWDPLAGQIAFRDRQLGLIRLSNGDRIALGGAPLMNADSPDQGAGQPIWIVPPDDSCPDNRWVVHSVNRLDR